uniref:Uncharacterized protein n=1 Tax=Anguilla anguilla TaxID=7936 RepID=A0A0E9QAA1_ANGAN
MTELWEMIVTTGLSPLGLGLTLCRQVGSLS